MSAFAPFDTADTPIDSGTTLLEASAGTGKTFAITRVVLRLLLERHVERLESILVVTFTKAATEELSLRVRKTLHDAVRVFEGETAGIDEDLLRICSRHEESGAEIVRGALRDFDRAQILTLHSFCKTVLEDAAFESGMPLGVELASDVAEFARKAAFDFWRRRVQGDGGEGGLATIAALDRWDPEPFVQEWSQVRARPQLFLAPAPQSLEEAAGSWREALNEVRAGLGGDFLELLAAAKTTKPMEKAGGLELHLRRLREFRAGESVLGIETALFFGRTRHGSSRPFGGRSKEDKAFLVHPFFDTCEELARRCELLAHALRAACFAALDEGCRRHLREAATVGFDDLLLELHRALASEQGEVLRANVRDRYGAAVIDEFQDTDPVQFGIVRQLFAERPLLLIGDPKQSIYEFRGADVFAYLDAKRSADRTLGLGGNWRSHPQLVTALNELFAGHPQPFVFPGLDFEPVQPRREAPGLELSEGGPQLRFLLFGKRPHDTKANEVQVWTKGEAQARIVQECAAECARLLAENPELGPGRIAILIRANREAAPLQAALSARGVPSVVARGADVFASDEAADIELILRAVLSPTRLGRIRAALATRALGCSAADLRAWNEDERKSLEAIQRFGAALEAWQEHGVYYALDGLLSHYSTRARLLAHEGGERRATNLLHVIELLHQEEQLSDHAPDGLLDWLVQQKSESSSDESRELRLEQDAESVQILTAHRSKGLEFDIVFCPSLWEPGRLEEGAVLVHENDGLVYDFEFGQLDSPEGQRRRLVRKAERVAEALRLIYVAMTRAKRRLYVVWGAIGKRPGAKDSGLAWLLHGRGLAPRAGESLPEFVARGLEHAAENDHQWIDQVREIAEKISVPIDTRIVSYEESPPSTAYDPPRGKPQELRARESHLAEGQLDTWRIASFSSIASDSDAHADPRERSDPAPATVPEEPASDIFAFARGPRAGNVLHDVLEHADLADPLGADNELLVTRVLTAAGLERPAAHRGAIDPVPCVLGMLQRLSQATVPEWGFGFGDLQPELRFPEWQFWVPLARNAPRRLADIYRKHARSEMQQAYAERLTRLSPHELQGFLTGFVDLLFAYEGRWYVVDWKSNWLGNRVEGYGDEALAGAMREHDYLLQSLLYQLALARCLAVRDPSFDRERSLGGSCYVFLRGLGEGEGSGLFVERADPELLHELDEALLAPSGRRWIGREPRA